MLRGSGDIQELCENVYEERCHIHGAAWQIRRIDQYIQEENSGMDRWTVIEGSLQTVTVLHR